MAQLARSLAFQRDFHGMGIPVLFKPGGAHSMHQEKVKILHAALIEHQIDQRPDFLFLFKAAGELVSQDKAFSGIPAGKAGLYRFLALTLDVGMGGVKIVEARRQEGIHHLAGLLRIHFLAAHGQAHHAEAEILLNFREMRVHKDSSWFFVLL